MLINSYLRLLCCWFVVFFAQFAHGQGYLPHYDPEKGFEPAARSLTTTFLKLAGSLEHHGDPEVYMRWVLKENARIDRKYWKVFGGFLR